MDAFGLMTLQQNQNIFFWNSYSALRAWITPMGGILLVFLIHRGLGPHRGLPRDLALLVVGAWAMGQFEALHRRRALLRGWRSDGDEPPQMRVYYGPGY